MFPWNLDDTTILRPLQPAEAPQVLSLIQTNRGHLDRWLRWSSSIQTPQDAAVLIDTFVQKQSSGDGFHLGIWNQGHLAGGLVCWYIHRRIAPPSWVTGWVKRWSARDWHPDPPHWASGISSRSKS